MRKSEGGCRGRGGWVAEIDIGEGEVRRGSQIKSGTQEVGPPMAGSRVCQSDKNQPGIGGLPLSRAGGRGDRQGQPVS